MKIIGFHQSEKEQEVHGKEMIVWPDSVWLRNGKPVFIPDEDPRYLLFALCLKVDRVGKTIALKFAERYYSEVALCAVIVNEDCFGALKDHRNPLAKDVVTDGCFITGEFMKIEEWRKIKNINIAISPLFSKEACSPEQTDIRLDIEQFLDEANETISSASRLNTLKTGDFLIPHLPDHGIEATLDTRVECKGNGTDLLHFNIK